MANWTVKQVTDWLKGNGFKKQVKIFRDKNIDGSTLMKLTDNDISQLFVEINEDGTLQEPTIGTRSRFRSKLIEWKLDNDNDETAGDLSIVIPATVTDLVDSHKDKHQEDKIVKKSKKKDSDNVKREATYLIDDEIAVQFFKNPKFLPYFINYIKQETFPIDIEKVDSDDHVSLLTCTIKFTGTKQQNQIILNFIKHLLDSINLKIYAQNKIKNWLFRSKSTDIIQNILNNKSHVFTVCQLNSKTLKIYYFDDEKFTSSQNLIEVDDIIQNQIIQENIIWSGDRNRNIVEFIDFNTRQVSSKYQICTTEQLLEEFDMVILYQEDYPLVSVIVKLYERQWILKKRLIEVFGYKTLVDEALQNFKNLFDKHRLRKFRFSQISPIELDYLTNLCSKELRHIEEGFRGTSVELHVQENHFYAPQGLKDIIRTSVKDLSSQLKTKTFKNIDLYYNTAEKLCLKIKNLAQKNHSYCEIKSKTKLRSNQIPKSHENTSNTSKSIIEQSNLFCASSSVFCQAKLANGSIDVLIGDIALQKVDVIIIPSTSFGLKESLIDRAGEIIQKQSSNENNSIPFITETTGGKLKCEKILFINWSLPSIATNDDDLSESIRLFISKSIQYVIKDSSNLTAQSIAFAIPDLCKQEEIFAEEIIEETINQINLTKSLALKVSFILLPDQQILHKQFLNTIQTLQKGEESFGIFYCPISTITITLVSLDDDTLKKCENKIKNYLKRSMFKMKLDGFQHWNQYMINAFYKYSIDKCVLPKLDNQQIVLYGQINNVYEVNQKYQLTNALIQEKLNLPSIIDFNIMLSYSREDSVISHRLANRLIDEGFSVWINSNHSIDSEEILRKITKSDCIILCTSRNYFQDELCEKEAKYADQIGKYIIPVKVEYYQPIEWLQKLIEKESYFQLFGSENNFNLEYEKLLLKILRYTKSGCTSSLEQTSNVLQQNIMSKSLENHIDLYFLLTPEQKKLKYEKNVRKLMKLEKGKITEDDKKDISEKLQEILRLKETKCRKYTSVYALNRPWHVHSSSYQRKQGELIENVRFDIGILSYRQWLDKLGNLKTRLNIAPFTLTGDTNDAVFPLLNEAMQNSNLLFSLRMHYSIPTKSDSSSEEKDTPDTNHASNQKQIIISSQRNSISGKSKTNEIHSKRSSIVSRTSDKPKTNEIHSKRSSVASRTSDKPKIDEINSVASRSTNRSVKRHKEGKKPRKIIPEKPPIQASFSESVKVEFQLKFAQQMQKNEDEFQKFCEDNEHLSRFSSKQKIQAYPTAIFGPSPFSEIQIKPFKTLKPRKKIELPLKFPWNEVFTTDVPSIIWKDPSVFFFFEATSSEKH